MEQLLRQLSAIARHRSTPSGLPSLNNRLWLVIISTVLASFAHGNDNFQTTTPDNAESSAILVLGDSISAGYGIRLEQGWVTLLQRKLQETSSEEHGNYTIVNASISGETTGGALARLPQLLNRHQPAIVIVELGGNDGLRGHPITTLRNNLEEIVNLAQTAGAKVLIVGMRIPPNYGKHYTAMFYDSFAIAAKKYSVPLVPFLLESIANFPELMQRDGIHPVAAAQPQLLENVLPYLKQLL